MENKNLIRWGNMTREEYLKKYKEWEDSVEDKYDDYSEDEAQYYYKRDEAKFLRNIIEQIFIEQENAK